MTDVDDITLQGGRVQLGGTTILEDLDFRVGRGEFVALLGDNGSGKTTLVRACLGLTPLERGRAFLFGTPLSEFHARRDIGYVPQRFTAASGVPATVEEIVVSGRIAHRGLFRRFRREDRAAAADALDAVGLRALAPRPVTALSGGQQQRVLIARALATGPRLLVLDEPVASVDLTHQDVFAAVLARLKTGGTSILLVAHSLGAMEPLVDRAVVLEGGRVVHDGAAPRRPEHDHVHHAPSEQAP